MLFYYKRCCMNCRKYGEDWYVFCPHCGGVMAERCKECGHFEVVNKKFCLFLANNASQDLHFFIKKKLAIYDKIFRYSLLLSLWIVYLYYYVRNDSINILQVVSSSVVVVLMGFAFFLMIYGIKKKKVIKVFKEENPKYLTILEKMGI